MKFQRRLPSQSLLLMPLLSSVSTALCTPAWAEMVPFQSKMEISNTLVEPPKSKTIDWVRVPYEKAEDEVLALFHRDVPKIEDLASEVAIYEVRTNGKYPAEHYRRLRSKLEKVLLSSKKMKIKQCVACEESRLFRTETGELKFEAFSTEVGRPAKIASELGVDRLVYSEITYTPEDVILRIRVVQPSNGQLLWTKEYSAADVTKSRENWNDADPDELGNRDSLSRVILGEIAFTIALSPGFQMTPTIDRGRGSELLGMPSMDLFVGEKFDRGRRAFGFIFGGAVYTGDTERPDNTMKGRPLGALFKAAPRFTYVFNPYNVATAKYSLSLEAGGVFGDTVGTAYVGLSPEIKMINRYSISVTPMYFFQTTAKEPTTTAPSQLGGGTVGGGTIGKWGGLALLFKLGMQW
jgi:hypothetical protein